jgi:pimeloyl-ACP methyl ester carboxylesterase
MTVPVLFLSGAGLPSWLWDEVRAGLNGRRSVVVDPPRGSAPLAEHAAATLAHAPGPRVAIVAHSVGGVVAAEVLARYPERVAGVLGVSAIVPRPGRSFVGTLPLPARAVLPVVLRVAGTRPPEAAVRQGLAAGLPAPIVDRLVAELAPESRRLFTDRVARADAVVRQPRGYLLTTADREVRPALQQRCAATLQAQWTETVDGGHLAPLEHPGAVLRAVERLLRDVR